MPPSQLKRLKASLREQGIVGPQRSKRQKKKDARNGADKDKRISRNAALSSIREQFNPFEVKTLPRGPKFEVTNNRSLADNGTDSILGRPGVAKRMGEETRKKTLLLELQRRNKVGGVVDRRFGENDPSVAPEEKMMGRFMQEAQRRHKNSSIFDLEDDNGDIRLTHMGQSLSLDGPTVADDFDEPDLALSDEEDDASDQERRFLKRRRSLQVGEEAEGQVDEDAPERKRSKQEVMKEVIAKAKLYKCQRRATKEEDEDMREALDSQLPELQELLRGVSRAPAGKPAELEGMNPERAARLAGVDRATIEKEYDIRLRQLALDRKAQPTERTKTEEERLVEESQRLQELEEKRLRRMEGEPESDEDDIHEVNEPDDEEEEQDDAEMFGLGAGIKAQARREPQEARGLEVEDEDDFIIDEDLVAGSIDFDTDVDSDVGTDVDAPESESEISGLEVEEDYGIATNEEADDFLDGLLTEQEVNRPEFTTAADYSFDPDKNGASCSLPYTFPCPQSLNELLQITQGIPVQDLPEVVRRIRALYHPKLASENRVKLPKFVDSVVDLIAHLADQTLASFEVVEGLIRHVHSMAKSLPIDTANIFRRHLEKLHESHALTPSLGDIILLTAVGTIFPTSDHFHQVVTPAMLYIGRYLGQKVPQRLSDYGTGLYLVTLALQYQKLSKRFIPEVIGFLLNTICALMPIQPSKIPGGFHYHPSKLDVRLNDGKSGSAKKLALLDTTDKELSPEDQQALMASLLENSLNLVEAAAETWFGKSAFEEVFKPAQVVLKQLDNKTCYENVPDSTKALLVKSLSKVTILLQQTRLARRPVELHHHRPVAIRMAIPKFEESFNPDKHYDPDRQRAELSKLRADHKRERKGAMRELRKDANFIARESLRQKKDRDAAYEKKYKRLVAEIQGTEAHEAREYEREKKLRKQARK